MGRPSKYSPEFRRDAVALVRDRQRPVRTVARELGANPETLRGWGKQTASTVAGGGRVS